METNIIGWRAFAVVEYGDKPAQLHSPIRRQHGETDGFSLWFENELPEWEERPTESLTREIYVGRYGRIENYYIHPGTTPRWARRVEIPTPNTHGFFVFRHKSEAVNYLLDDQRATFKRRYRRYNDRNSPQGMVTGLIYATCLCYGDAAYCQPSTHRGYEQEGFRVEKLQILGLYSTRPANARRALAHKLGWPKVLPISEGQEKFPLDIGGK